MGDRFQKATAWLPGPVRKLVVFVIGGTVLIVGILMIVLPGPAVVVIPLGLAILSLEFVWAGTLLKKAKDVTRNAAMKAGLSRKSSTRRDRLPPES